MNTNNVYKAFVFVKYYDIDCNHNIIMFNGISYVKRKNVEGQTIYINIRTGEKYLMQKESEAKCNIPFIDSRIGLIPYAKVVKNCPKYMSKKKILKKVNENKQRGY